MGLHRIVTLFHSKLNTLGDSRAGVVGGDSGNGDSGSERNDEDFGSSTTMSLSSSVESLALSSSSLSNRSMQVLLQDYNNNSARATSNGSILSPVLLCATKESQRFSGSSANEVECRKNKCNGSFEDVLLVLGTEGGAAKSSLPCKRNSGLSRRFSLKAKFSSDLDLYGKVNGIVVDNKVMASSSSSSSVLLPQAGGDARSQKKSSIWGSFRLPIRLIKGNIVRLFWVVCDTNMWFDESSVLGGNSLEPRGRGAADKERDDSSCRSRLAQCS